MTDGIGLGIGAANVRAVHVGRAAVTRSAVLTRYARRPPEVGVPGENPNLTERGLIITDFVDRVGDPVPIIAADGTSHRAEAVAADALRALLRALTGGAVVTEPIGVAHPAHWRPAAIEALRGAIAAISEFHGTVPAVLVSDATAALVALQRERGLPSRGVVAVCDFGATGTSVTLADAGAGFAPIAATVRVDELSGDVVDQALLTRLIADLTTGGSIDPSGTSALGSLTRLRSQCRAAKERLSTTPVTALTVDSLGHRGEVRITRNELDEAIRAPLAGFVAQLQDTLRRNDVRPTNLVAVASIGGGAHLPVVTTTLSEQLRVPIVTAERPELTSTIGAGLRAARGTVVDGATSMAPAAAPATSVAPATRAAAPVPVDAPRSTAFQALAWSAADDAPDVLDPFEPGGDSAAAADPEAARPRLAFDPTEDEAVDPAATPWYRRRAALSAAGLAAAFVVLAAVVLFAFRSDPATEPATSPGSVTTTTATPSAPPPEPSTDPTEPATEPPAPEPPAAAPQPRTVTRRPAPPSTVTVTTEPPAAPAPSSQPAPSSEPPPSQSQPPPASTSTAPPVTQSQNPFNLPYSTLPGLPFVPAPPGIPAPSP